MVGVHGEHGGDDTPAGAVLALGPANGTGSSGDNALPQFIIKSLKSKDLFLPKFQKTLMGRTVPR